MVYSTRSSRVKLSSIDTLTFYAEEQTAFRRTGPVDQLTCKGKPCTVYQPPVVQCQNMGGSGSDIEWACNADLPSSMRFGRVEVSCEGYDSPDDPYVLKGSCGLTYNLVGANPNLEKGMNDGYGSRSSSGFGKFAGRFVANLVSTITLLVLLYILYTAILRPLMRYIARNAGSLPGTAGTGNPADPRPPRPWFGGFGGGGGGGGGGAGGRRPPPPPYSGPGVDPLDSTKTAYAAQSQPEAWRPGFWSGLAAGTAGLLAADRLRNRNTNAGYARPYEQPRYSANANFGFGNRGASSPPSFGGAGRSYDRGEGTSGTSGSMRSSTGFGGTRNR